MADSDMRPDKSGRRLTIDFAAWLDRSRIAPERFFREGLVVLDANVLLDLYRTTAGARSQIFDALEGVAERLWVPHHAAIEFSRNRKSAVVSRVAEFKRVKRMLETATAEAVEVLGTAVARLLDLRERGGSRRAWDVAEVGLNRESLESRLTGILNPALAELAVLENEHDLHPGNIQYLDPLLLRIDELLANRIGPAYDAQALRAIVEEAYSFRFPNQVPPGYLDSGKETQLRGAGDALLWRQTIDRAAQIPGDDRLVLLITKDLKADWWEFDARNQIRGPRPELVQELRDTTGADLLLLSLKDFVAGVGEYLAVDISDGTLRELTDIGDEVQPLLPPAFQDNSVEVNLLDLDPRELERLIHYLLVQRGYSAELRDRPGDYGIDILLVDPHEPTVRTIVQVKRSRLAVGAQAVLQMRGALDLAQAQSAMLISTSWFSKSAQEVAQGWPIQLIDGQALLRLLAEHGIRAQIEAVETRFE